MNVTYHCPTCGHAARQGVTAETRSLECSGCHQQVAVPEGAIEGRLARRPLARPEWDVRTLRSGADVRRFGEDVKQRVARWRDADE